MTSPPELDPACSPSRRRPRKATILLIEDDSLVRETTGQLLQGFGCRVLTAATDDEALWLWAKHRDRVDLVVTDLMLPTCSTGVELARRFRQDKPGLPVILISGFGRDIGEDDPEFPRDLPFLPKPFAPEALQRLIDQALVTRTTA